jgi:hypothetical protein
LNDENSTQNQQNFFYIERSRKFNSQKIRKIPTITGRNILTIKKEKDETKRKRKETKAVYILTTPKKRTIKDESKKQEENKNPHPDIL